MATNNFFKGTNNKLLDPVEQTAENPSSTSNFSDKTIIWNRTNESWYKLVSGSWVAVTFDGDTIAFNDLGDVSVTGASDGQTLAYDAATATWKPTTISISGSNTTIDSLTNVNIGSVANNDFLKYDSSTSNWKNTQVSLNNLADISTASPSDGQAVVWDSSNSYWKPSTITSTVSASDLTDYVQKLVTTSSVSTSQSVSNSDLDKTLLVTGDVTFTLPDAGISDGFQCTILNTGTGAIDFAGASGSTVTPNDVQLDNSASDLTVATLIHTTGGQWYVIAGETNEESTTIALSDESTSITAATGVITWRAPYAFTLTRVRAHVNTAPTGANIVVDINEGGVSVLSTKLSIDATEKTSVTASQSVVVSDTTIADDAELTFDIDQVGSTEGGKGLKVTLYGVRS